MAGHSRPKDGVASLAYVRLRGPKHIEYARHQIASAGEGPAIHVFDLEGK
jgi:hypothetical protein